MRVQIVGAMIDCFETLDCDASDDRCSVLDDSCVAVVAFTDAGREKLADCLDLERSQLEGCLRIRGRDGTRLGLRATGTGR